MNGVTKKMDTAFILAAGRGERMRPLTDRIPKPLVQVAGKPLLQRHFERLLLAGFTRIIVNHAHLGEQITYFLTELNNQQRHPCELLFSAEPEGGLETAGGIVNAMPLIQRDHFLVINGDIWIDFPLNTLRENACVERLAHLVLVPTPEYKSHDDFFLGEQSELSLSQGASFTGYTFSGLSILSRDLFEGIGSGKKPLAPLLKQAISQGRATAELYSGNWCDVGTVERLKQLRSQQNKMLLEGIRNKS